MSWTYDGRDSGLRLFTAAMAVLPILFASCRRVLEVGCCEADWLHVAHAAWPHLDLVGIDTRAPDVVDGDGQVMRMRGDVMDPALFTPASFDAVVSISALEHIGLGHYGDPVDPEGDTKAIANIWRWLMPGGFLYFDVPYSPELYEVLNTECRIYDDDARWMRLWSRPLAAAATTARWLWTGYCDSHTPDMLIEKPTEAAARYWYAAHIWQKGKVT